MKKKLIILLVCLVAIITTIVMVGCCKEELPPPAGGRALIYNVNDLSIILGKEYLYPPNDDLIYRIYLMSPPVGGIMHPPVYYKEASEIAMYLIIDNVKTKLEMSQLAKSHDFSDDAEYELINDLKVYSDIDLNRKTCGVFFQYSNMFYAICVDTEAKVFEKLTDAQIEHYIQSLKDYVATFKLYAE